MFLLGARMGMGTMVGLALLALAGCDEENIGAVRDEIAGGVVAEEGAFPATGALLHNGRFRCTATLISPGVAITAAHCLMASGGDFSFTLQTDVSMPLAPAANLAVNTVHAHPDFDPAGEISHLGHVNDIGVVLLQYPVTGVSTELLDGPTPRYISHGSDLEVAGYGLLNYYTISTVGIKRDAVVQVDQIGAYELQTVPSDPQPCRGDSGGPLFVDEANSRRLTAIVSRSASNDTLCQNGAIATLVTPYLGWIAEASLDRDSGCAVGRGRRDDLTLPVAMLLPMAVWRLARRNRQLKIGSARSSRFIDADKA